MSIRNEPLAIIALVEAVLAALAAFGVVTLTGEQHAAVLGLLAAVTAVTRWYVAGPVTWGEMVAAEDVFERASRDG